MHSFKGRESQQCGFLTRLLYRTREGIEQAKSRLEHWLKDMGLEMKPSKTRVAHTLEPLEAEAPGFDFLGFEVRQYPVGKHHSGTLSGRRLGFKTLIRPSKEAIKRHREALRAVVLASTGLSQGALIGQLNPKIRGWSRYYRSVAAKKTLNDCDYHLFPLLLRWAKRRHTRKSASWIRTRYWRTMGQDHWRFATPDGLYLSDHAATAIQRHVKVKGNASPFDGNLLYWARRLKQSNPLPLRPGCFLCRRPFSPSLGSCSPNSCCCTQFGDHASSSLRHCSDFLGATLLGLSS